MTRAYPVILRNDVPEGALQWVDLVPNTSQRDDIYTALGQTGYVNPDLAPSEAAFGAVVALVVDATIAANDVQRTNADETGLLAYLVDRVNADPGAADTNLTIDEAARCVNLMYDRVTNGLSLTVTDVNTILTAVVGAATDLDGDTVALSDSFGSIEDIARIAAGERYQTLTRTIITDNAGTWLDLASRQALVAAATTNVFYAQGQFLARPDSAAVTQTWPASTDFVDFLRLYLTGALRISIGEGNLSHMTAATFPINNPDFVYGGDTTGRLTPATSTAPSYEIASINTAAPSVCTTTTPHGLANGDTVRVSNADGAGPAGADPNTTYTATVTGSTTFTLGVQFTVASTRGQVSYGATAFNVPANTQGPVLAFYDADGNLLS